MADVTVTQARYEEGSIPSSVSGQVLVTVKGLDGSKELDANQRHGTRRKPRNWLRDDRKRVLVESQNATTNAGCEILLQEEVLRASRPMRRLCKSYGAIRYHRKGNVSTT